FTVPVRIDEASKLLDCVQSRRAPPATSFGVFQRRTAKEYNNCLTCRIKPLGRFPARDTSRGKGAAARVGICGISDLAQTADAYRKSEADSRRPEGNPMTRLATHDCRLGYRPSSNAPMTFGTSA